MALVAKLLFCMWMPQTISNGKSTLGLEMAWCRQTASHYLSQCWPRFLLLCGVTWSHRVLKAVVSLGNGVTHIASRKFFHYADVIMSAMASQITGLTIVYSTFHSGADQRKHQSSASLALCVGNSPETGEFPAQKASNAENVSIWWRHHVKILCVAASIIGKCEPLHFWLLHILYIVCSDSLVTPVASA